MSSANNPCLSVGCIAQIPGTENKMSYLLSVLCPVLCNKTPTFGLLAASGTATIPAGSQSWSITITGVNATVGGVALPTGTVLSGNGPLNSNLGLITGSATTIAYSYETCVGATDNP